MNMSIVCFTGSVIILFLYCVSPISGANTLVAGIECLSCMYNHTKKAPSPELLWANTTNVVLRARLPCSLGCESQILWYMEFPTVVRDDRAIWKQMRTIHCYRQEYCVLNATSRTSLNVTTAFWSNAKSSWVHSEITVATVCPESPPPVPKEVTCAFHQGALRVRWRPQPDECHSYSQYMVRIRNDSVTDGGAWRWVGEAPPAGRGGSEAFAGDVRLCSDNVNLLCADLGDSFHVSQVQLGIRRMNTNISDEFISKTEFVDCLTNEVSEIAADTRSTTTTTNSNLLECNKEDCTTWRSIAFLIGGALLIVIVLLPLSFITGIRCERSRGNRGNSCSSTSRQHINDNQSQWNGTIGTQDLISTDEVPPAYTYDYTYRDALQPRYRTSLPPLPEEHRTLPPIPLPPLRSEQGFEVQNDLYVSEPHK